MQTVRLANCLRLDSESPRLGRGRYGDHHPLAREWQRTQPALQNTSFMKADGLRLVLVDCGYTVPARFTRWAWWTRLADILITHLHADHVGGLERWPVLVLLARRRGSQLPSLHLPTLDGARQLG